MTKGWTEDDIAAFIDGALEEERMAEIEEVLARDPEALKLAEEITRSNDLLRAAYADVAAAPVPQELLDTVLGEKSNVVSIARRPRRVATWLPAAIAASVTIVIGIGIGSNFQTLPGPVQVTLGNAPQDSALATALETVPSGTMHGDRIVPMLTFADADGRYCREFEVTGDLPDELEFGIACRTAPQVWHVEIIVTAPEAARGADGFVPASGPGSDALEAMLDALGAGLPLTADEERRAIEEGWSGE